MTGFLPFYWNIVIYDAVNDSFMYILCFIILQKIRSHHLQFSFQAYNVSTQNLPLTFKVHFLSSHAILKNSFFTFNYYNVQHLKPMPFYYQLSIEYFSILCPSLGILNIIIQGQKNHYLIPFILLTCCLWFVSLWLTSLNLTSFSPIHSTVTEIIVWRFIELVGLIESSMLFSLYDHKGLLHKFPPNLLCLYEAANTVKFRGVIPGSVGLWWFLSSVPMWLVVQMGHLYARDIR